MPLEVLGYRKHQKVGSFGINISSMVKDPDLLKIAVLTIRYNQFFSWDLRVCGRDYASKFGII